MGIVGWVAVCSRNSKLKDWLPMQCIKGGSTLRVAPKGDKPSPRLVYRFGCQDHAIKDFFEIQRTYQTDLSFSAILLSAPKVLRLEPS